VLLGSNYIEERVISVETPLSESGNLCVLQEGKVFIKKNRSK